MRSLIKDLQKVWFVSVKETKSKIDTIQKYGTPIQKCLTVSASTGMPGQVSAGLVVDYDREIVSYDKSLRGLVVEGDCVFIDVVPSLDENGSLVMSKDKETPVTPPDYRVTQIFSTRRGQVDVYGIKKIGAK